MGRLINSDDMRHRVRIEYELITQDPDFGTDVVVWAELGTRWGNVQDVLPSRSESVQDGLEVSRNQTRLRMLYWTDIDSSMRVKINDVAYQIISGPAVIGDKDGIELMLEKVSS